MMLRETEVSVDEFRIVVKENSLENHFKELKSKVLFEKFLLIPNKKDHTGATEQQKTMQEYEDIFFGKKNNSFNYDNEKRKLQKNRAVEELDEWELDEDYKTISDSSKKGDILKDMMNLLLSTVTDSQDLSKHFKSNKQQEYKILERNVKAFSEFLSEILDVNDKEFERRQHLMFLLAIKKLEGYNVAKPVWLRRKADEWGSKFVMRRKINLNYEYITIMDGEIDTIKLKEGQTIGFNTHHTATSENANIQPKKFLELHILPTPALVGDELEEVFDDLLEKSIKQESLDNELKNIISAMFEIYHAPSRIDLRIEKTADIPNSFEKNVNKLYPRLFASNKSAKVKDIFLNASLRGLNLDDITDLLVFNAVTYDNAQYIWVHCDEWARNCFVSEKRDQLNWLDFEDSVYIKYGDLRTGKIIKNGGRCWNRLTSRDGKDVPLDYVHLNAISSFARLFTATLQFYSVRDIYRDEGKLENYTDIIDDMFKEILGNLETWADKKKKQEKGTLQKPELFIPKIQIQFLLACYDWAIHWDEHKPDKPNRSWSMEDNQIVFEHFENAVIKKISELLYDQEVSNKFSKLKQNVAKDKKAEDEKERSGFVEDQLDALMNAENVKKYVKKLKAEKMPLRELIKHELLHTIDDCITELQRFLIKYKPYLVTDKERPELQDIDEIYREHEMLFINDVLFRSRNSKKRHRKKVYRLLNHSLLRRGILDLHINDKISDEWKKYYKDYQPCFDEQGAKNQVDLFLIVRMHHLGTDKDVSKIDKRITEILDKNYERNELSVKKMMQFMDDESQRDTSTPDFFLE